MDLGLKRPTDTAATGPAHPDPEVLEARVGLLELLESEPKRAAVLAAPRLEIQARLVPGRETGPFAEPPALLIDESLVSNILTLSF